VEQFDRVERNAGGKAATQHAANLVDFADRPKKPWHRAACRIGERRGLAVDREPPHPLAERGDHSALNRPELDPLGHQDSVPASGHRALGGDAEGGHGDVCSIDEPRGRERRGVGLEEQGDVVALGGFAESRPAADVAHRQAGHPDRGEAHEHPFREPPVGSRPREAPERTVAVGVHEHLLEEYEGCPGRRNRSTGGRERRCREVIPQGPGRGRADVEDGGALKGDRVDPLAGDAAARGDQPRFGARLRGKFRDDRRDELRTEHGAFDHVLTHRGRPPWNPLLDRHPRS